MIQISKDFYVNPEEIAYIAAVNPKSKNGYARKIYQEAKNNNSLLNTTGNTATRSVIVLKNGYVIASRNVPSTIIKRIRNIPTERE